MLTVEANERLTRVSPGTPMGELMRRYWHPIAATSQVEAHATRPIRLLGENLVLYKDRQGRLGLIGDRCPHRKVHMIYGGEIGSDPISPTSVSQGSPDSS